MTTPDPTPPAAPRPCDARMSDDLSARDYRCIVPAGHTGAHVFEKPRPVSPEAARYETRSLTFGSYRGGENRRMLTHTVEFTGPAYRPLCRVSADALDMSDPVPGIDEPPTCATCRKRDPRFAEAAPPRATTPPVCAICGETERSPRHSANDTQHRFTLAPSRESGALLDAYRDAWVQFEAAVWTKQSTETLERLQRAVSGARAAVDRRLSTLERDAARMREALEFYADPKTWKFPRPGSTDGITLSDFDLGNRARAALTPSGEPTTTPETSE